MFDYLLDGSHAALTSSIPLVSVGGDQSPIFPPTCLSKSDEQIYLLSDGPKGKYCQLDSEGSQANRMEELFKSLYPTFIPAITVKAGDFVMNAVDLGHRIADAVFTKTKSEQRNLIERAISAVRSADHEPLAKLMPLSLVFGFWDSRGQGIKCPRIVQSTIIAHDVMVAQRQAAFLRDPSTDHILAHCGVDKSETLEDSKTQKKTKKGSVEGFLPVPPTARLGGVFIRGQISREVIVQLNLITRLKSKSDTIKLHRYILGLVLLAALTPQDLYLRQGCNLVLSGASTWKLFARNGERNDINFSLDDVTSYAKAAAVDFGVGESVEFILGK